jgi:hypothetical protein
MSSKGPRGPEGPPGDDSLKPEGFSGRDRYEKGIAPIRPLKLTPGMTLSSLAEEYVFFNHGVLFSYGELPIDPAEEYVEEFGSMVKLVLSPAALFKGLSGGNPLFKAWEYALALVPKEDWAGLATSILQTAIVNKSTGSFFRPYVRELTIHDWLQSPIANNDNQVSAALFGLDGNKEYIGLTESKGRMRITRSDPKPETVQFGKQVLMGQNPYDEPGNNGSTL